MFLLASSKRKKNEKSAARKNFLRPGKLPRRAGCFISDGALTFSLMQLRRRNANGAHLESPMQRLDPFPTLNCVRRAVALFLCGVMTAFPLTSVGRAQTARYFDESRLLLPLKSTVRVNNPRGDVRVIIGRSDYVEISAKRHKASGPIVGADEVLIEDRGGQVTVSTSPPNFTTGVDLEISLPAGLYVRLYSDIGALRVEGTPAGLLATTARGSITLTLPETSDADIALSSSTGVVKSALPVDKYGAFDIHTLQGKIGKGGPILVANAGQGDVIIESGAETPAPVQAKPALLKPNQTSLQATGDVVTPPPAGAPPGDDADDDVVRIESSLVTFTAKATTRDGRTIPNLTRNDFEVFEDNVKQEIGYFEPVNAPFNLVLLIDLSGSLQRRLNVIRQAAQKFISAVRPADKVAIVTFSETARIICPLTDNRQKLAERLAIMSKPDGGTNFYDALSGTLKGVLGGVRGERNAVVILSDGLDNSLPPGSPDHGSAITYEELLEQVQETDAILYPIYLDTEAEVVEKYGMRAARGYAVARRRLQELADVTGGVMLRAQSAEDLEGRYEEVATDLRTVYSLGYYPTNTARDGAYRRIQVKVKGEGVIRARRGYSAPRADSKP